MTSKTITKIPPLARYPLNPSTAHQSPPHSAASTLNPSTTHQSTPHSAVIPLSISLLNRHLCTTNIFKKKTVKDLIYSRERPFNVIGPQRPRPIYAWPLHDHQSQMSQTCELLTLTNKYK